MRTRGPALSDLGVTVTILAPAAAAWEPDWSPSPPGETLAEVLAERGMTADQLAQQTGREVKFIHALIEGSVRLTDDIAAQLEAILDMSAILWLTMEHHYRAGVMRDATRARSRMLNSTRRNGR
jgi:plasmid maintenance system antidote protein VapI